MTEQIKPRCVANITNEEIWGTALAVLAEAPDDDRFLDLKTLAEMTADAFYITGPITPETKRVASLLRVKLPRFMATNPSLLTRGHLPKRRFEPDMKDRMGGWYSRWRWDGPSLGEWAKDAYPMPTE